MHKLIGFVALFSFAVAGTVSAATPASVTLSGSPEVFVVENESCQELIYTYLVNVASGEEALSIEDVTFEIKNEGGDVVASEEDASAFTLNSDDFATSFQELAIPCLSAQDHEIYSDDFEIEANGVEDFTVKVFFTPDMAGSFAAYLTGIVFGADEVEEEVAAQVSGGAGKCLNCEDEVVLGDSTAALTLEELMEILKNEGASEEEVMDIVAFLEMLKSLGLL